MGIILSNAFVDVSNANITARSQATGFEKINVMDRWNLKRRFRAADATANDYLLKFDLGTATPVQGIFLNDVNFNAVVLQGDDDDSWTTPDYTGDEIEVFQNIVTGRYQVYIPLSALNRKYVRLFIPSGTSAVGRYTTKWEIGTVCLLQTVKVLSHDMSWDYGQTGKHFYKTAVNERVKTADEIRWEGDLVFGNRPRTSEQELWELNRMDLSQPFVYYENDGDTSAAYLCVRDDAFEIRRFCFGGISGNTIKIKEAYQINEF